MNHTEQRVSSSSSPTQPSSKKDHDNCSGGSDEYDNVDPSPKPSKDPPQPVSCYFKRMNREKEYDIVNFPIPEHCVGLVIGKNGSEVNAIHEKTGCRLQVHTEPSSTGFRMVEIHGPRNRIEMAKDCISQIVCRVNRPPPGPNSYGNSFGNPHSQFRHEPPPKQTAVMSIPPNKVGPLIGKGGDTLRKLRNFTNCSIQLIQDSTTPNSMKPLKITGDPRSVIMAQRAVNEFLAGNDNFLSTCYGVHDHLMELIMTLQVRVPRSSVGAIMGDQGRTVKDLAEKTGAKIQVLPDEDHKSPERMIALVGTHYQVHLAAAFIKEIIETSIHGVNESSALFYLDVPSSRCGLVIGKGGETIKQINAESGAHCEVQRDGQPNPLVKTFVIKGTELQMEHAKHLIFIKVGDIPPNTPFVPSTTKSQYGLLRPQDPMQLPLHPHILQQANMQSPLPPQMQAQLQARLHAQFQAAQMHAQQQLQARSPQQNTLTNVQMWTGQPIIQNQNPNHPQTQLLQQQIQQRQAQQQQQLQQQHFQQLQQQHLQQQRLQQQQAMAQSGQYNQSNFQGRYNAPGWQGLMSQQSNLSMAGQSGMENGNRSQQFSPPQRTPNKPQRPYQPQQQPQMQFSPHKSQSFSPSPAPNPAQSPYEEPSSFGQNFIPKPSENENRESVETARKEQHEIKKTDTTEAAPDYSEDWYQYYLSINDHENAENVRIRIEEMKAEKAKKASAAASPSSQSRH